MNSIRVIISFIILTAFYSVEAQLKTVPGTVINFIPASAKTFIGSPGICILPNGNYVASHDHFGPATAYNKTVVFRSEDKGLNWIKIAEIDGQFWSSLFIHNNDLYLLGTSKRFGDIVIRRSTDGGATWTIPDTPDRGLLRGGGQYHCAPTSVIVHNGRIWRAFEKRDPPVGGAENHFTFMLSAPVNEDLLNAEKWTASEMLRSDRALNGWLEGNAVVSPDGQILNILRVNNKIEESAAIIHVSENGRLISFDAEKDIIKFPGGCKKFVIRYDQLSKRYWTLSNWIPEKFKGFNVERTRNTLALVSSADLRSWVVHSVVLQDDNLEKSGFQYVDWLVEGNDIIFVSRTAFFDGVAFADNQHNSNFITFHRINNFRKFVNSTIQ